MPGLTYLQFYVAFLVMAVLVLIPIVAVFRPRAGGSTVWARGDRTGYWLGVAAVTFVALVYTVPWDNYLIGRGVWYYGDGATSLTLWRAPLGEYLFILTQPLLTGLWLSQLALPDRWPEAERLGLSPRLVAGVLGLLVGVVGWSLLATEATFYLGAILLWSAPVLTLQWAVGAPQLIAAGRTVVVGTAAPTIYLCAADRIALSLRIWTLSEQYTTGIVVFGLPVEEAVFFLLTNLFVVQGLVLYRWVRDRFWEERRVHGRG